MQARLLLVKNLRQHFTRAGLRLQAIPGGDRAVEERRGRLRGARREQAALAGAVEWIYVCAPALHRASRLRKRVRHPCPIRWIDNFAMRNFTNDAVFDDTLPVAMDCSKRESWFRWSGSGRYGGLVSTQRLYQGGGAAGSCGDGRGNGVNPALAALLDFAGAFGPGSFEHAVTRRFGRCFGRAAPPSKGQFGLAAGFEAGVLLLPPAWSQRSNCSAASSIPAAFSTLQQRGRGQPAAAEVETEVQPSASN